MCLVTVLASSLVFDFESSASDFDYEVSEEYIFNVPYARPSLTSNSGYFNLMTTYTGSNGVASHSMDTYVWSIGTLGTSDADASTASGSLEFHSNYFRFYPEIGGNGGRCVLSVIHQDGQYEVLSCFSVTSDSYYEYNYSTSYPSLSIYIEGVQYYGNYSNIYFGSGIKYPYNDGFVVNYADTVQTISLLNEAVLLLGQLEVSNQAIYNQLFESNSNLRQIWKNQDEMQEWLESALATIDSQMTEENAELDRIYEELRSIHEDLLASQSDKNATDKFASDSQSQSNSINDLNEQNKMDKIDIDSASDSVDNNIDMNAVGNYGIVLSTFTNNAHVLQMMLIVLAISLVAYVLFGKR